MSPPKATEPEDTTQLAVLFPAQEEETLDCMLAEETNAFHTVLWAIKMTMQSSFTEGHACKRMPTGAAGLRSSVKTKPWTPSCGPPKTWSPTSRSSEQDTSMMDRFWSAPSLFFHNSECCVTFCSALAAAGCSPSRDKVCHHHRTTDSCKHNLP